ncbi:hypothetical protein, partial [Porphyromonas sp. COT-290 OH860]|uniref:hypothetical protein n=1 Tax=Porphyromonas sp. COT-290 OH860 TaxID=1515615 RepID=UPI001F15BF49
VDTVNYILKIVIIRDIHNVSSRKEAKYRATVSTGGLVISERHNLSDALRSVQTKLLKRRVLERQTARELFFVMYQPKTKRLS